VWITAAGGGAAAGGILAGVVMTAVLICELVSPSRRRGASNGDGQNSPGENLPHRLSPTFSEHGDNERSIRIHNERVTNYTEFPLVASLAILRESPYEILSDQG
jgi:hypothetical protein